MSNKPSRRLRQNKPTFEPKPRPPDYHTRSDEARTQWLNTQPHPIDPTVSLGQQFSQAVWIARALRVTYMAIEKLQNTIEDKRKTDDLYEQLYLLLVALEGALGTFSDSHNGNNLHLLDNGSLPDAKPISEIFSDDYAVLEAMMGSELDRPLTQLEDDAIPTWADDGRAVVAMFITKFEPKALTIIRPDLSTSYAEVLYAVYQGVLGAVGNYAKEHPEWVEMMKERKKRKQMAQRAKL